jgi:choline dehydrogenase
MHDLLIIGAGSSGSAIAARATENPNLSVLLLEAGPDYPMLSETPADIINSHNNSYTDHDWGLKYSPTQGRSVPFPRGRVTGGSSSVNTTIALRGIPEDYNGWADLGNSAWRWENVLPAFNRLERDLDFGHLSYHGDAGPISIRRYPREERVPQQEAFLDAAEQLGYPLCEDQNDPQGWGAGPQPMNKIGRLRVSSAGAYLAPIRLRPNLEIRSQSTVTRLLFDNKKCIGAEVLTLTGETKRYEAKTTVLCAGAIMSPAIMLRSGIGPKEELEALGITTVVDVPGVGKNLCDHPALAVVARVKAGVQINRDDPIIQTILRYTAEGSDKRNDLQIEQISFAGTEKSPPAFSIAAVLEYQYGRGELTLQSADPKVQPNIHNRFCEDERDCSRLVQCMKDTLRFTESGAIADMIESVVFPDPARGADDETLATLCKRFSGSGYHPCGTLKMGPNTDPFSVVDQHGCCHSIDQLVVADASIMPYVPSANTNLSCIMIGEMIGEWIRTNPGRYGL